MDQELMSHVLSTVVVGSQWMLLHMHEEVADGHEMTSWLPS